ncbi:hypothetical protein MTO96_029585 [Rhipicephalus appendiculatus]
MRPTVFTVSGVRIVPLRDHQPKRTRLRDQEGAEPPERSLAPTTREERRDPAARAPLPTEASQRSQETTGRRLGKRQRPFLCLPLPARSPMPAGDTIGPRSL